MDWFYEMHCKVVGKTSPYKFFLEMKRDFLQQLIFLKTLQC